MPCGMYMRFAARDGGRPDAAAVPHALADKSERRDIEVSSARQLLQRSKAVA